MAVDTPKITRMRLLAAKIETTTGTAETLTAAEADFLVMDPVLAPDFKSFEIQEPATMGLNRAISGGKSGTLTFSMYMAGKGATSAVPEWATTFLPACDWEETTGTFAATHGGQSLTLALYEDGTKRMLIGARGTFKITCRAGEPAKIEFTFTGKYGTDADATMLAPTFPTVMAPVWGGGTCTLAAAALKLSEISIDAGNAVTLRESPSDATGYFAAAITSRAPKGAMDPETLSIATRDWLSKLNAGTEEALSIVIGATQYNTITIAAAKAQATKYDRGNRNDLMVDSVELQFNGTSPFTIAFS